MVYMCIYLWASDFNNYFRPLRNCYGVNREHGRRGRWGKRSNRKHVERIEGRFFG